MSSVATNSVYAFGICVKMYLIQKSGSFGSPEQIFIYYKYKIMKLKDEVGMGGPKSICT